ncbi:MAG: SDR family NAD(P)-dependent oxidoreductase [Rhizobiaceae bacterium]
MLKGAAVIVGGSGGIGQGICRSFAAAGVPVLVTYRSGKAAAENVSKEINETGGRAIIAQCDLTKPDTVDSALAAAKDAFGDIGAVVLASGPSVGQEYVSKLSMEAAREAFEADVIGFLTLAQKSIPILKERGGGSIVALSSIAVHRFPPKDILGGLPKSGVEMLCRGFAKEEGRFGIRFNCVAPGFIEAGLGKKFMDELYTPDVWDRQRKETPLRRFGQPSDIGEAVLFLASDRASFVTGQTLVVDGGFCL